MNTENLQLQLNIARHPDGEYELTTLGYLNIDMPLLHAYLAMKNIFFRQVSYHTYVSAQHAPSDWKMFIEGFETFVRAAAAQQKVEVTFSAQQFDESTTYTRSMEFIFEKKGEWLYCITPATVDEDLYGSDHGMYEHQIIKVPDIFQAMLIERWFSKHDLPYQPIWEEDREGYKIPVRKANLNFIYDSVEGFVQRMQKEIESMFDVYAKSQGVDFMKPQVSFILK